MENHSQIRVCVRVRARARTHTHTQITTIIIHHYFNTELKERDKKSRKKTTACVYCFQL